MDENPQFNWAGILSATSNVNNLMSAASLRRTIINLVEENDLDRLVRNLANGRFDDVMETSGLGDASFSHGVAVRDSDAVGFPDIQVSTHPKFFPTQRMSPP